MIRSALLSKSVTNGLVQGHGKMIVFKFVGENMVGEHASDRTASGPNASMEDRVVEDEWQFIAVDDLAFGESSA